MKPSQSALPALIFMLLVVAGSLFMTPVTDGQTSTHRRQTFRTSEGERGSSTPAATGAGSSSRSSSSSSFSATSGTHTSGEGSTTARGSDRSRNFHESVAEESRKFDEKLEEQRKAAEMHAAGVKAEVKKRQNYHGMGPNMTGFHADAGRSSFFAEHEREKDDIRRGMNGMARGGPGLPPGFF